MDETLVTNENFVISCVDFSATKRDQATAEVGSRFADDEAAVMSGAGNKEGLSVCFIAAPDRIGWDVGASGSYPAKRSSPRG